MEALQFRFNEVLQAEGIVLGQWCQVHREPELIHGIDCVALVKGGVGSAATDDGFSVVFAPRYLRFKAGVELFREFGMSAYIKGYFVLRCEPVEIAPNFAAVDFLWAGVGRQPPQCIDHREKYSDMSRVSVGGIVGIQHFGLGFEQKVLEPVDQKHAGRRIFYLGTREGRLRDKTVIADPGGFLLFFQADRLHFVICLTRKGTCAGAPASIGASCSAKPLHFFAIAKADAVKGHKFEIVLMCPNPEVRGSRHGFRWADTIGHVIVQIRLIHAGGVKDLNRSLPRNFALTFKWVGLSIYAMANYTPGQRWISETEPELGLGILESASRHQLEIRFPASNETRIYATASAPIKRVEFRKGDSIHSQRGESIVIEEVSESEGRLTYLGGGIEVPEALLADTISFSKPEDRLISGQIDQSAAFRLRYEAIRRMSHARQSPVVGFIGGRIDLIPHQLYIAAEVANRYMPRVLLADEVGLGKTIEACLILHRLHLTGRAERALIVLPESLVHQWFIELLRRFNLWFTLFDAEQCESATAVDPETNPFNEEQLVICSIKTLLEHPRWAECASEVKWDMLIVDEAHHLEWTPDAASPEYQLVERLTQNSHGLLLLTATPEQLGAEGHFARLRLLDPDRYPSLEKFREEQANYSKVAEVANKLVAGERLKSADINYLRDVFAEFSEEELKDALQDTASLLDQLVDRHGTGRVIFRNTRDALEGFPRRSALPVELPPRAKLSKAGLEARLLREFELETGGRGEDGSYDFRHGPRIQWLAQLLQELGEHDKVLLICRTREKVQAIYDALLEEINVKAALFHEALTLLQRDRNAAWFAEPEGARILLCSEIGSEGRNFQFAHHLILFDLPLNPELLEQRIGRLDRIGQTEVIRIHLPFLPHSWTELLMRWHHEGLDGVEHSLKGGSAYLNKFGKRVHELGAEVHHGEASTLREVDQLIAGSRQFRDDLETRLSQGQDRLIALNSFREGASAELVTQIQQQDADRGLDGFMNRIFDHFGVTVEDLDTRTYHLSPGQLFTDAFPCLPEEGTTVTCDRTKALGREDIGFLTWDHPMVRGAIDLMLSSEKGNSAIVVWQDPEIDAPPILIEAIYVLESVAPSRLHVDRFLPPTPVRVLVDMQGVDRSDEFAYAMINKHCADEEAFRLKQNPELLQTLVPEMLRAAREFARLTKSTLIEEAMRVAHARLDGEAARLRELRKVNSNVREEEIRIAENVVEDVTRHIAKAHLRLDAVRLILREPNG